MRGFFAVVLCVACSDGGGSVGCRQVAVCTLITVAQVNAALGNVSTLYSPSDQMDSAMTVDSCLYNTQETSVDAKLMHTCYASASTAAMTYQADHDAMLNPTETRTDASGVGVSVGKEGMVEQGLIALANQLLATN